MKFGKRLAAEAARRWRPYYLDYKSCKRAIQQDVLAEGGFIIHISFEHTVCDAACSTLVLYTARIGYQLQVDIV